MLTWYDEKKTAAHKKKLTSIGSAMQPGGTYQLAAILNEQIASMSKLAQIMRLIKKSFPFATS